MGARGSSALRQVLCKHPIMHEPRRELHLSPCADLGVIFAGVILGALWVAYFYLLDRFLFSSAVFSPIFRFLLERDRHTAWLDFLVLALAAAWTRPAAIRQCVDFL